LTAPFVMEEIKMALDGMHPAKSPGPDGMNACFFQKYWGIVQHGVVDAALKVLNEGADIGVLNETFIALIPKVEKPEVMTQLRPISLCNIVYKLVAKALANRLRDCLGEIICINQSAFVIGRSIYDNSMVAHEIVHTMQHHKGKGVGEVALKLDMSKAYDRVEWIYLEKVMEALGFATAFRKKVMACVTSVQYAVLLNGAPTSKFTPGRGLRQGDPLSPYLFILCVEGFAALLEKAKREGKLAGVAASEGAPRVSHLFFADDSLLFMQATKDDCLVVRDILKCYEMASGQSINLDKSAISYSMFVKV
ncbi:MAG: reverse transcriptase family protein, partial ['Waltheria sp.' little leaf phytoplasma]|nr:reverse transcriptase family protein ['Waltheria sp.' little leaf phytoplasma]